MQITFKNWSSFWNSRNQRQLCKYKKLFKWTNQVRTRGRPNNSLSFSLPPYPWPFSNRWVPVVCTCCPNGVTGRRNPRVRSFVARWRLFPWQWNARRSQGHDFLKLFQRSGHWIAEISPLNSWVRASLHTHAHITGQRACFPVTPHGTIWVIHRSFWPIGDELRGNKLKFMLIM